MSAAKPITIIGGGLAGLTLGIGLRQRGIPVTVWEAGGYPRHRVCGEFVSGKGQAVLAQLGVVELFLRAGATLACSTRFFLGKGSSPVRPLPSPALCLSRFAMDAVLARHFQETGGELREHARWQDDGLREGIVRASGRRLQPLANGWRWFGLKVHARNASLTADLEMHGSRDAYVGVSRLDQTEVNVCGLFRRRAGTAESASPWQEALRGEPDSSLRRCLAEAVFDESSFCSVAGLSLKPVRAARLADCCIGDALTMIPPVTGNGMSMAFEAAGMAIEPVAAYSTGNLSWPETQRAVAVACDEAFRRRLAWARWLQWLMFTPVMRSRIGQTILGSDWIWGRMFEATR